MIGIALAGGNPDELVEIMPDRLGTPDDYLEIARAMERADRRGEAIRWARRGLTAMGTRFWQSQALREMLAPLFMAEGYDEAAEDLWWEEFTAWPTLQSYRRLIAGTTSRESAAARERAIGELHARGASEPVDVRSSRYASVLVEVLLYEGQADEAWEVGTRHKVSDQMWMKLAQAREAEHPLDAIPIYERAILGRIGMMNAGGYRDAVKLLKRIEKLAAAGGEAELFRRVLGRLVEQHRRKPTLMEMLRKGALG